MSACEAATIAVAVNTDGRREVLGMATGASEAETFWTDLASLGNIPITSVRRLISPLTRSSGCHERQHVGLGTVHEGREPGNPGSELVSELDAALLATEADGADLASQALFAERFLAALPPEHPLAAREMVAEADLARDILVLADGHCLRDQTLAACGDSGALGGAMRASSLSTLLNMVAAGYGTTLIPGLAAGAAQDAGIVLRPLAARASRTVRIVWRAQFPRRAAVTAVGDIIAARLRGFAAGAGASGVV